MSETYSRRTDIPRRKGMSVLLNSYETLRDCAHRKDFTFL